MAKLSPVFNDQTLDSNGNLASGYKLFTYVAGSSTKVATYTNESGSASQTNPIILNANGYPPSPIWLSEGQQVKFVLALPTDTDPPTSPIKTIDDVSGIGDTSINVSQWVASGIAPTYISATSYSVPGDQTTDFHVGRRQQFTVTSGTVYGTVISSAYNGTSLTTITLTMDSGQSLDTGLSAVNHSILRADNSALPYAPTPAAGDTSKRIATMEALAAAFVLGTPQTTTSGTSKAYSTIPPWVKRITLSIAGLSTNGASVPVIQIGDSGGIESAGYIGSIANAGAAGNTLNNLSGGFLLSGAWSNSSIISGVGTLTLVDSATNTWAFKFEGGFSNTALTSTCAGHKALTGPLDRIQLTTSGGTDTFDAGIINIMYE